MSVTILSGRDATDKENVMRRGFTGLAWTLQNVFNASEAEEMKETIEKCRKAKRTEYCILKFPSGLTYVYRKLL